MLHTSTVIVVDIFLNLGLALALGRLVDRHLDIFIKVSNND